MEKLKNKSNFCIRPFNSAWIDAKGDISPCCMLDPLQSEYTKKNQYSIKKTDLASWWKSDYLKYLRSRFLEDKRPTECSECWKKEDTGLSSFRMRSNTEHHAIFKNKYQRNLKLIGKEDLEFPEDVHFNITNLCNLKCQMCSGENSSKLLVENNALGYEDLDQKDFDLKDSDYVKMLELVKHDLKILKVLGGEPLFNPRVIKLLEMLVQNGQAKKIKLHVTTNGTMCNDKIISLLKKFKDLRLVFSVDGVGKCNEYMRFPSKWEAISANITKFKENLMHAYIMINCVVQNLNVLYVDELLEFTNQKKIFVKFDLVLEPHWLHLSVLPKNVLSMAYKKLSSVKEKNLLHTDNVKEIIKLLRHHIDNYNLNEEKYKNFLDMVNKRDNYRKVELKNYMPELAKEIFK